MKIFLLIVMTALTMNSVTWAKASQDCQIGEEGLFSYEKQVLQAAERAGSLENSSTFMKEAQPALVCLFHVYLKTEGLFKAIAGQWVSPFLGAPLPKELPDNPHYSLAQQMIEKELQRSPTRLGHPVFAAMGESHWSVYLPLCSPELSYVCRGFLQGNQVIRRQPALMGAVSVFQLWKAAQTLDPESRGEILQQLKTLEASLPEEQQLLRQVIQEALEDFPSSLSPLGLLG